MKKPWVYHDTKTGTIMVHDYLIVAIAFMMIVAALSAVVAAFALASI